MYGDTRVVRGLAATLRDQADEIAHEAVDLVSLAEECPWSGWAAEAMRRRSHERATVLRRTAGDHREAADSLARHADEVDRVKELIAAIETRVLAMVSAARDRLGELVREVLPDRADELLDRFVPPPSGHRDWLDVDLPGQRR